MDSDALLLVRRSLTRLPDSAEDGPGYKAEDHEAEQVYGGCRLALHKLDEEEEQQPARAARKPAAKPAPSPAPATRKVAKKATGTGSGPQKKAIRRK